MVIILRDPIYDVHKKDGEGKTAAFQADPAMTCLLLERYSPHLFDEKFRTPLHVAARNGYLLVAKILLAMGSDIEASDRK